MSLSIQPTELIRRTPVQPGIGGQTYGGPGYRDTQFVTAFSNAYNTNAFSQYTPSPQSIYNQIVGPSIQPTGSYNMALYQARRDANQANAPEPVSGLNSSYGYNYGSLSPGVSNGRSDTLSAQVRTEAYNQMAYSTAKTPIKQSYLAPTVSAWSGSSQQMQANGEISYSTYRPAGDPRDNNINNFFNTLIGNDAFAPYRADIGGNIYDRPRSERALSYSDMFPDLYGSYVNNDISGRELISRAYQTGTDRDTMNGTGMKVSALPVVSYRFSSSGVGISSRGYSFSF